MYRAYRHSIVYFLLFGFLLLLSAFLLFDDKIGFSYHEVLHYYIGYDKAFMLAKTPIGLLKIIVPHLLSFALFIMVITHFLIFTHHKQSKQLRFIIKLSYLLAFIEILSPFLIMNGLHFFAFVKLFSFVFFELIIIYTTFLLLQSILYD